MITSTVAHVHCSNNDPAVIAGGLLHVDEYGSIILEYQSPWRAWLRATRRVPTSYNHLKSSALSCGWYPSVAMVGPKSKMFWELLLVCEKTHETHTRRITSPLPFVERCVHEQSLSVCGTPECNETPRKCRILPQTLNAQRAGSGGQPDAHTHRIDAGVPLVVGRQLGR